MAQPRKGKAAARKRTERIQAAVCTPWAAVSSSRWGMQVDSSDSNAKVCLSWYTSTQFAPSNKPPQRKVPCLPADVCSVRDLLCTENFVGTRSLMMPAQVMRSSTKPFPTAKPAVPRKSLKSFER